MNSILVHFLPVFFPSLLIHMGSRAHIFTRNKSCSYLSAYHITVRLFLHNISFHPHNSPARDGLLFTFYTRGEKLAQFEQVHDTIRF